MVYGKKFWYQMQYGVGNFQYGMEMEWKKIAKMKYGKIVFHSITYHPLVTEALSFFRFEVYGGWPQSGEIDILEARGQFNDQIATALHYGGVCCDQHFSESSLFQTQCKNDRFHVYSLDWFPTHMVRFYSYIKIDNGV